MARSWVIVFFTKPFTDVDKPLSPTIMFELDRADGTKINCIFQASPSEFSASSEQCDVRIGPNRFQGDLHTYEIHVEIDDVVADLTLRGTVPSWRPETGYFLFGEHSEYHFAWLPSVPQGDVEAAITIAGNRQQVTGVGYHDHNWGNFLMAKLMNNWYWGRGAVGNYTTIASFITAEERYGYEQFPIFMLARNGQILADDATHVQFEASDVHTNQKTGKPVADVTKYTYRDDKQHYVVTFRRKQTIMQQRMIEQMHGIARIAAQLMGFDGAYHRFTGDIQLDRYEGDKLVESLHEEGIWELMYFGHVHN
jgi:hypothetical protein